MRINALSWKNKGAIQHLTVMEFITHILNNCLEHHLQICGSGIQDHEYKVEKMTKLFYKQISGHSILWPRLLTKQ
jgi:hypothetical protein